MQSVSHAAASFVDCLLLLNVGRTRCILDVVHGMRKPHRCALKILYTSLVTAIVYAYALDYVD